MSALHRVRQLVPTLMRVAWAEMFAYRAEMVIWILTATLPLVMLALWNAAAADGPIGRFGQIEFARYFAITLVVRQLTGSWVIWDLNYRIRTGELSPALLRPLNPLVFNFAETIAALPFRLVVLAPVLGLMLLWRPEIAFRPDLGQGAAFAVSVVLALVLSWLIQVCFGILSFFIDQSMGLFQAYFALWGALSGYFLPMSLLPNWLAAAARYLPFHASLGASVDLLMGGASSPWETLAIQVGWVGIFALATSALWRAGVRRYGAFGA